MNKFKLGDIVFCPLYDKGDLLITSIEKEYYKARYINGPFNGDTTCIHDANLYDAIGNIFEKIGANNG